MRTRSAKLALVSSLPLAVLFAVAGACGSPSAVVPRAAVQDDAAAPSCPPDITKPIPTVPCPSGQEPIGDKISVADTATFEQGTGAQMVLVSVTGGATICPLMACGAKSCPANDAVTQYWAMENLATQRCVRAAIAAMSATSAPDSFWLIDTFDATLTWPQIQQVAQRPDVVHVEADMGGSATP